VRYLEASDIRHIYRRLMADSSSVVGLRDSSALESAVGQPFQTFEGRDLYDSFVSKAAALAYFLIRNHPFIDGNKRVGHAALEVTLAINGLELSADVDEQESIILRVADGSLARDDFTVWVNRNLMRLRDGATRSTLPVVRDFPLINARMTTDRASRIRHLRVEQSFSWRMIASQCFDEWGADAAWEPPTSQIAGMELCDAAAELFGESFMAPPWN
jgi:death on curing protein